MGIFEFAQKINGREYGSEITHKEEMEAKESGIVVVVGVSDDLTEFYGAIDDEVSCYNGCVIHLDKNGLFADCDSNCSYAMAAKGLCKTIEAIWGKDGYSWTYKTDIPHATFDIFEDGEKFCRGIVFDIKSLS